jgi:hypothetical protein
MKRLGNYKLNIKKFSKFELFSATREYAGGIASNRKSASYGETVLEPCTHRPSRAWNFFCWKFIKDKM